MTTTHSTKLLTLIIFALVACGDDPVSHSAPVGIELNVRSGDVDEGALVSEKNINTESGNPFAAFITEARNSLGADPQRFEVESVELTLQDGSRNVMALQEVFNGTVEISFIMNDDTVISVASTAINTTTMGAGPFPMTIVFDSGGIPQPTWTELIGGSFKVRISGPAHSGFEMLSADADVQATFTFSAFAE